MKTDLTYTNRAGISLQNIYDILNNGESIGKKDIQDTLNTTKSIDTLLKKLEDLSIIGKEKNGNKILYTISKVKTENEKTKAQIIISKIDNVEEPKLTTVIPNIDHDDNNEKLKARIANKAKPKRTKSPVEVDNINKQTAAITKNHQIKTLIEVEEIKTKKVRGPKTEELNQNDLDVLKKEMESKLGKEVTAVLHKRNEKAIKKRKETAQNIYAAQQSKLEIKSDEFGTDTPYRFVTNFFVSTLNGEKATPYFRRRDEYVVKSIYNKFKSLCDTVDNYDVSPQNLPFYRVITINMKERAVKMYHIDMNRIVRGVYVIFKLNQFDDIFIKFKE